MVYGVRREEMQASFDDIKNAIINPPVLALSDPAAALQMMLDVSCKGIGAVLEQRLSKNFFWHNMYKDTKNFVRYCIICLSRKNAFKIPPAPHQPVEQSQEPGETCHIDIFGPLKTTPKAHVSGRVEKPNQSLANILAAITHNTNNWDEQLTHTMLALNSVIHEATYTSPFFLEHGRDIRLSYTYQKLQKDGDHPPCQPAITEKRP
ncbi:integrase catalytic domain-containing protein [Trichonephila clavipes]|nr:integrase catalytic domain-containing protein [Trichonephila clavipes]